MRLSYPAKFWITFGLVFFAVVVIFVFGVIQDYRKLPESSIRQFNRQYEPYEIGSLKIGWEMPWGPGDSTFAPYLKIPAPQKFYVSIAEPDIWCINGSCGIEGDFIQTMGGWLQVEDTYQSEVEPSFGLDLPENNNTRSMVIIGDRNGRIVGLYPNKVIKDILNILKNHPNLADFDVLFGVREFGKLKVGGLSPLKPGDQISQMSEELKKRLSVSRIPEDKKFYLYALEKRRYDIVGMYEPYENTYACILETGCRYPEPDPHHDFLFETMEELGGWFLANDQNNLAMIELFDLDPQEVLSGKSSLVVLTDSEGVILALHPNKTLSDTFTILSQHPKLVHIEKL